MGFFTHPNPKITEWNKATTVYFGSRLIFQNFRSQTNPPGRIVAHSGHNTHLPSYWLTSSSCVSPYQAFIEKRSFASTVMFRLDCKQVKLFLCVLTIRTYRKPLELNLFRNEFPCVSFLNVYHMQQCEDLWLHLNWCKHDFSSFYLKLHLHLPSSPPGLHCLY